MLIVFIELRALLGFLLSMSRLIFVDGRSRVGRRVLLRLRNPA